MNYDKFPLLVKDRVFQCYLQCGGFVAGDWIESAGGAEVLVVCECGQAVFASEIDDAIEKMKRSVYLIGKDHYHYSGSTSDCNVITAYSQENFIAGKIKAPELLPRIDGLLKRKLP